ncbi:hypothetical protein GCM10025864_21170 [Luteimicrobium album]|uniref:Uncharacterized protein n=1 Tax=Luteimicrobium album TaxID=1054550 RepID=A0ABQ6I0U8_9MICO|nr:hypothetical protein GCM10025864_21170 [Luteimicrobium album]
MLGGAQDAHGRVGAARQLGQERHARRVDEGHVVRVDLDGQTRALGVADRVAQVVLEVDVDFTRQDDADALAADDDADITGVALGAGNLVDRGVGELVGDVDGRAVGFPGGIGTVVLLVHVPNLRSIGVWGQYPRRVPHMR